MKYTKKVREQRLCCVMSRTCFISKHLKPFITRHPELVGKVMEKIEETGFWVEDCKESSAFVAGYLGSMLLKRIDE